MEEVPGEAVAEVLATPADGADTPRSPATAMRGAGPESGEEDEASPPAEVVEDLDGGSSAQVKVCLRAMRASRAQR